MSDDRDVWRQWALEWTPSADTFEVAVRAVGDTETLQPHEAQPEFPSGRAGWVSRTVRP